MEGDATYNPQTGEYVIRGTGATGGVFADYGHVAYSEITGDFRLKAKVSSDGPTGGAYIGFVDDLEDRECTFFVAWVVQGGTARAFWRTPHGGTWEWPQWVSPDVHDGRMEIVRKGNVFNMYYYDRNTGERVELDSRTIELTDPIHVCLGSYSDSYTQYNVAHFSEVELTYPVGIFEDHRDFGDWTMKGDATYNPQTGEYVIRGTGPGGQPYGHVAYSKITGDFRLKAKVSSDGPRVGYMGFVDDLEDQLGTWYVAWVEGEPNAMPDRALKACAFWRTSYGVAWENSAWLSPDIQDGRMEVVREGNLFSAYYYHRDTGERILFDSRTIEFTDPIYVCLASISGIYTQYNVAHFSEVELTVSEEVPSAVEGWELYK